jgi:protein-tyrosine phosphatase
METPVNFVDCHSHVVPSGDDGAQSVRQGIELCREAARRGTAVLFATPHVWPHLPLTAEREAAVHHVYERMRPHAGLELRLGFELAPERSLLREDLSRYELGGTGAVLIETPFVDSSDVLFRVAEHAESCALVPVLAHPERTETVLDDPGVADELAARNWKLQVNATSVLGLHGPGPEDLAWRLLESGRASLIASDGHRAARPARVDQAYELVRARLGERAIELFDGSALGVTRRRTPSRAASTGA